MLAPRAFNCLFTSEFAAAISAQWPGGIFFGIGCFFLTIEHKIRGVMHQHALGLKGVLRQERRQLGVDVQGLVFVILGQIHRRVGAGIEDDVR